MNNRQLYLQLLDYFRQDQSEMVNKLRVALESGDLIIAERVAHTLKGAAGLIGAGLIQGLAGEMERTLRRGGHERTLQALLQQLDSDMQALLLQLTPQALRAAGFDAERIRVKPVLKDDD